MKYMQEYYQEKNIFGELKIEQQQTRNSNTTVILIFIINI